MQQRVNYILQILNSHTDLYNFLKISKILQTDNVSEYIVV